MAPSWQPAQETRRSGAPGPTLGPLGPPCTHLACLRPRARGLARATRPAGLWPGGFLPELWVLEPKQFHQIRCAQKHVSPPSNSVRIVVCVKINVPHWPPGGPEAVSQGFASRNGSSAPFRTSVSIKVIFNF